MAAFTHRKKRGHDGYDGRALCDACARAGPPRVVRHHVYLLGYLAASVCDACLKTWKVAWTGAGGEVEKIG